MKCGEDPSLKVDRSDALKYFAYINLFFVHIT